MSDEKDQTVGRGDGAEQAEVGEITDDQLPEDVRPDDDNPLAQDPDEAEDGDGGISLGPDGPQ